MIKVIPGILAILTCCCFYLLQNKIKYKTLVWIFYSLLFAICFYLFIDKLINRFNNPTVWDFTSFYLWGKVAAGGHNFYLAENSQLIFNSLELPKLNYDTFNAAIVNVGFLYPPPAILCFVLLGFLPYKTALVLWTIFNLLFLVGSIKLVYELFLKRFKTSGLILVVTLVLIFSPVRSTVFYSQTNFILLYLLLLMKKYSDKKSAGIYLALAMCIKPYMVVFLIYFLINKKWNAIIYFVLSGLVLLTITASIFGIAPIISYIFDNPVHRLPISVFFEDNNQSLHSILLRANIISLNKSKIFYLILAGLLLIATLTLLYLKRKKLNNYIWPLLLLFALIIYPGTLDYYGVLLLFIIFQFFGNDQQLAFKAVLNIPIIAVCFLLGSISVFTLFCFLLVLIYIKLAAKWGGVNSLNSKIGKFNELTIS